MSKILGKIFECKVIAIGIDTAILIFLSTQLNNRVRDFFIVWKWDVDTLGIPVSRPLVSFQNPYDMNSIKGSQKIEVKTAENSKKPVTPNRYGKVSARSVIEYKKAGVMALATIKGKVVSFFIGLIKLDILSFDKYLVCNTATRLDHGKSVYMTSFFREFLGSVALIISFAGLPAFCNIVEATGEAALCGCGAGAERSEEALPDPISASGRCD